MGARVFGDCSNLTAIVVDDKNPNFISVDGVLFTKDMKTLIAYPVGKSGSSYTIPDSVTNIMAAAFYSTRLTSVTIPNSVTFIGNYTFANTYLTEVTIPASVTSIGEGAFSGNKLTSTTVPDTVTSIGKNAFQKTAILTERTSTPFVPSEPIPLIDVGFGAFIGIYLNGGYENLLSFGFPLQLGAGFNFANMTIALFGDVGIGLGVGSLDAPSSELTASLKQILLEWNYGGLAEFYFPHRKIGLSFGYGMTNSMKLSDPDEGEYDIEPFDTTYMRFGLIFLGDYKKTTFYTHLYGDGKWGFGFQRGIGSAGAY
jgi:hypothetical protein